jgi:hypothetical protein
LAFEREERNKKRGKSNRKVIATAPEGCVWRGVQMLRNKLIKEREDQAVEMALKLT